MRYSCTEIRTWLPKPQSATLIVAASNSLHRERADYVCDGVADQVEILAAINSLPVGGGAIILLDGRYLFNAYIPLTKSNVKLKGCKGTYIDLDHSGGDVSCAFRLASGCDNVEFDSITFDFTGDPAGEPPFAINASIDSASTNCYIHNCNFIAYPCTGITGSIKHTTISKAINTGRGTSWRISNNHFYGMSWEAIASACGGAFVPGYHIITGNTIENHDDYGYGGIVLENGSHHCIVANNKIHNICPTGAIGYGIYILHAGTSYNIIANNTISNCTMRGIYVDADADDNIIAGNYIENCNSPFIDLGSENEWSKQYSDLFMDVLAVSATHVRSDEDLSEAIPNTFTIDAQPDVPRTLSGHFDSHAQITAYTIVITGIDAKGNIVTETFTEAVSPWDFETVNAYATITNIIMTARTGTGAGDTMDIGITDVLGLSNKIYATSDVYKIKKNNANALVAIAQVNTTYDTYDMAVIGLAATDDFTIWYRSNLNIVK